MSGIRNNPAPWRATDLFLRIEETVSVCPGAGFAAGSDGAWEWGCFNPPIGVFVFRIVLHYNRNMNTFPDLKQCGKGIILLLYATSTFFFLAQVQQAQMHAQEKSHKAPVNCKAHLGFLNP